MTADDFRSLALALPGTTESSHMRHPDFRANGRIFATLHYPDAHWGMVKLSPEEQHGFAQTQPDAFVPVKGAWGRQGCTYVRLEAVDTNALEEALRLAWRKAGAAKPTRKRPS
jgi:hypothetical protein